jgi:DNA polymerase-3 subunit beta
VPGVPRESFPEVPSFKSAPVKLPAQILKTFIDRTIFAITLEESRYTLSGAKFIVNKSGARMVTTDGHRLAFIERKDLGGSLPKEGIDVLIPRKTLAEVAKLAASHEGEVSLGADENHVYFEVGARLLISRLLTGQFPNYEMVMPKESTRAVSFDASELSQAIRRVAVMADDRSHAIRFNLGPGALEINSQNAEEGEAQELLPVDYQGEALEIGFNAQYLQDFLSIVGGASVRFEFKDSTSQAQMRPAADADYDYRYVVMPMRV